jgi:hypothetical protein
MPLHHWPNPRVPWRSFHNHWIVRLVEYLNQGILPPGFQARPTEFIVGIEPDLLLLQEADHPAPNGPRLALSEATTTAVLPPPAELPIVGIYSAYDTSRLVAVIEIVSPGNKDRPEAVQSFVEKAIFLLQDGVHIMVIDVISLPQQPMRQPILERLGLPTADLAPGLWLSSYCAIPEDSPYPRFIIKEWASLAALNTPLPTLPLFLQTDQQYVIVDLEQTYQETLAAGRYRPT